MVTPLSRVLNHWFHQPKNYKPEAWVAITAEGEVIRGNFDSYVEQKKIQGKELVVALTLGRVYNNPQWNVQYLVPYNNEYAFRYMNIKDIPAERVEEVIEIVTERRDREVAEEAAIQADPEAHLRRELKEHDWYYCMSDDSGVFRAGHNHLAFIRKLMEKVPNAQQIVDEYNPEKRKEREQQDGN